MGDDEKWYKRVKCYEDKPYEGLSLPEQELDSRLEQLSTYMGAYGDLYTMNELWRAFQIESVEHCAMRFAMDPRGPNAEGLKKTIGLFQEIGRDVEYLIATLIAQGCIITVPPPSPSPQ